MAVSMIGPKFYAWDRNGKPLAFGKVYTYQARTNEPKPTYQSEDQKVANTNPVILNGEGYANIYLSGSYKIVLKDDEDNEIWTADPVSEAAAGNGLTYVLTAYYVTSSSFKVLGDHLAVMATGARVEIGFINNAAKQSTVITAAFDGTFTTVEIEDSVITTDINTASLPTGVSAIADFNTEAQEQLEAQEQSFQDRFAFSQPTLPWQPGAVIADELQLYSTGVIGESGYSVWLADPDLVPFTTSATFPEDEALGRWTISTVATREWSTKQSIARSLNVQDYQVIYSADKTTVLDDVLYIYNAADQVTWGVPALNGAGETIVSVTGSTLVTTGGTYDMTNTDARYTFAFASDSHGSAIDNMIAGRFIDHVSGNVYMAGTSIYECLIDNPLTISDFKLISESVDFSAFTQDAAGLNDAVSAKSLNSSMIVSESAPAINGTLVDQGLTDTLMMGGGDVGGTYRKYVTSMNLPPYQPKNTINQNHLKVTSAAENPVCVLMGDSISGEGPNSLALTNSMWSCLKSKLVKDNDKDFEFYNRAIGGQTWLNANTKPTAFPVWYPDTGRDWLEYVEDLQPDLLFLAFGMNDSNGFNAGAVPAVINKIKLWAKVPDIIFITNPVPSQNTLYPDGAGFGFVGQTFQDGRDYPAGYERTFARYYGYGVIDINRAMVAMRDCYAVDGGILRQVDTAYTGGYTATDSSLDFAFRCVADGALWAEGEVVKVNCSLGGDSIFIKKAGGNFVLEGSAGGVGTYATVTTTVAVPAFPFDIEVSLIDGIVELLVDPAGVEAGEREVIAQFPVIRHGGIFLAQIGWQSDLSDGPFTEINYSTSYGQPIYSQSLFDYEIWGVSTEDAETKPTYGGNGINHYAAQGITRLVRETINACDLSATGAMSGLYSGGRWAKNPDGTSTYHKKVTRTVNITAASGGVFVEPSGVTDTDFPDIFLDTGGSNLQFSASYQVMSDGAAFCWAASDGTTKLNNALRYRLAATSSQAAIDVDVLVTMLGRWK